MSEDDIRKALGDIPIYRYPEIRSMQTPDDLFKGHRAAVLLFLTENETTGHWIAVLDHPDSYEVFDSFGTAIDGDRAWLSKSEMLEFDECCPLLGNLLKTGSKRIIHNTTKLQDDSTDTCGFWVVARILDADTPLREFVRKYTMKGAGSPDQQVVATIGGRV